MKLQIVFVFGLLIMSLSIQAQSAFPDVTVKTLEGQRVDIKTLAKEHKLTVVSFWATWCGPCLKELDAVKSLYPEWQSETDVQFIAVTIDNQRSLAKVKPLVASKQWPYTILSDANEDLKKALNFQTPPQTYILDAAGNILYSHSGYLAGEEYDLEEEVKKLGKE